MQRSKQLNALNSLLRIIGKEQRRCDELANKKRAEAKRYHLEGTPSSLDRMRMCAQRSCDYRNEATEYLRLSHQLEAVRQKYQRAITMASVTQRLDGINAGIDRLQQMVNPTQMIEVATQLERNLEDLQVADQAVGQVLEVGVAHDARSAQVEQLIQEIAQENSAELRRDMQAAQPPMLPAAASAAAAQPIAVGGAQVLPIKEAAVRGGGGSSSSSSSSAAKRPSPATTPPPSSSPEEKSLEEDVVKRMRRLRRAS